MKINLTIMLGMNINTFFGLARRKARKAKAQIEMKVAGDVRDQKKPQNKQTKIYKYVRSERKAQKGEGDLIKDYSGTVEIHRRIGKKISCLQQLKNGL